MMISFILRAAALSMSGLFLFFGQSWTIAGDGSAAASPDSSPPTSIEQALSQVISEDESVRDAAIRVLIEQGDVSLLPQLEAVRANADRSIRQATQPVMDSLRNRANLTRSEE